MRMVFGFVMLLLGFFTTTNYARWWRLRTLGIGRIWSNAASLTMYLCTLAPEADGAVIKAIDRYARASLMWLFMTQRGETSKCEKLVFRGLLISEEADLLNEAVGDSPFASTCIWGWIADILQRFRDCGALDSFLFVALMDKVNEGRSGAELVLAQLSTPIPVSYLAFIGWLTKMSATIQMFWTSRELAGLIVTSIRQDAELDPMRETFHWSFVAMCGAETLIYVTIVNALLCLNRFLCDPFDGDDSASGFPMSKYNDAVQANIDCYIKVSQCRPRWLDDKFKRD